MSNIKNAESFMTVLTFLESKLGKGRIRENVEMAKYTTFKTGGPAKYFYIANTSDDLIISVRSAIEINLPFFVVGSGSNILISDTGFAGLIIKNATRQITVVKKLGKVIAGKMKVEQVLLEVDSGTLINQLVRYTCNEGLYGLERHLGLPGTVGGALYMNSKWTKPTSYVSDCLYQAKLINAKGEINTVDRKYFDFAYDVSILQKKPEIVLTATFLLKPMDKDVLWARAQTSMDYRKQTQPMGISTAGCTFRNIPLAQALRLKTPNNTTSAGYLLDAVGLKNFQIGKAKFSDKHANFIINIGGATYKDISNLIIEAKKRVMIKFNVELEPEIVILGDNSETEKV